MALPRYNFKVGEKFGRLVITGFAVKIRENTRWRRKFPCLCSCGREFMAMPANLMSGHTKSCGCYATETRRDASIKHRIHGEALKTPEYKTWSGIKSRCYYKKDKGYHNYGGRGIVVCDRWRDSFKNFLDDVGRRPSSQHSIERIDNNKGYEPGNVRWATDQEQSENRRTVKFIEVEGVIKTYTSWAKNLGVAQTTVGKRIAAGWPEYLAATLPKNTKIAPYLANRRIEYASTS